jgi:TPR repeat protein
VYRWGYGVSRDYKQAMDWNMKAASTGNAEAQYLVGDLYYLGFGVQQDYKQAMDWFIKAGDNGNTEAMYTIGMMYQLGNNVTANISIAIEWYTKAANQGNKWAPADLGTIYETKDEVKDLQLAVNWYQKAADNDYYGAKEEVEHLNAQGYYAKEDDQEGIFIVGIYFMMIIIKNFIFEIENMLKLFGKNKQDENDYRKEQIYKALNGKFIHVD